MCPGEVFGDTGECRDGCLDGVDEEVDGKERVFAYTYIRDQHQSTAIIPLLFVHSY